MKLNQYLNFNGSCDTAKNLYKDVLNGEITMMSRFTDMPEEVCEVPDDYKQHVMHCTLEFDGNVLMGSDTLEPDKLVAGTNYSLSVSIASEEEAAAVFNSLAEGGHAIMPFEEAFWGGKFGMLIDRFGIQWMVSSEHKPS